MDLHMNKLTSRNPATFRNCMTTFLVLFVFHVSLASPQQDKWLELGKGQVSKVSSSAFIPLDAGKGTVCALRFQQVGAGLEIDEMTVRFSNSQSMHIALPVAIKLGGSDYSPSVHLPGNRRNVRGLEIVYRLMDADQPTPTESVSGNLLPGQPYCPK